MQTAVIAMPLEIDASIDPLQSHEAVLVSYQGETWIVTTKGRHAIDLTDRALTSSMGIPVTARPTPISEGMFNALPDMGPWQLPPIPAAGAPNSLGLPDDLVIGSVFQIHTDKGPQYYVVLPDGIAQVNATTAAALRATQAHGLVAPPAMVPSLVVRIAERVYPHRYPMNRSRSCPGRRIPRCAGHGNAAPATSRRSQRCCPAGICRYRPQR